jgi:hypothetical protein
VVGHGEDMSAVYRQTFGVDISSGTEPALLVEGCSIQALFPPQNREQLNRSSTGGAPRCQARIPNARSVAVSRSPRPVSSPVMRKVNPRTSPASANALHPVLFQNQAAA